MEVISMDIPCLTISGVIPITQKKMLTCRLYQLTIDLFNIAIYRTMDLWTYLKTLNFKFSYNFKIKLQQVFFNAKSIQPFVVENFYFIWINKCITLKQYFRMEECTSMDKLSSYEKIIQSIKYYFTNIPKYSYEG